MADWIDIAALILAFCLAILGIWNRARIKATEDAVSKVECLQTQIIKLLENNARLDERTRLLARMKYREEKHEDAEGSP